MKYAQYTHDLAERKAQEKEESERLCAFYDAYLTMLAKHGRVVHVQFNGKAIKQVGFWFDGEEKDDE